MPITYQTPTARPKSCGHTKAQPPIINLAQPGRLRVAHIMALLGVSHSTLYQGIKNGRYPKPDGRDGKLPYWKTGTVNEFLETGVVGGVENE